jgi:hypothetical protein
VSTEKHTTIIEVDVSQALAADAKLRAATEAQTAAAKKLAAVLEEGERARIEALRATGDAAKQATADRREAALDARKAIAAAKEEAAAMRHVLAAEKEREQGLRQTAAAAKAASISVAGIPAQSGGFLNLSAGIGSIVTGLGTLAAGAERAVRIADEAAAQSLKAQQVSANLQVSIGGARDAFKGYVDDIELARIANMAFEMGVVTTGDELAELAAGVQAKSERLGVSSTELFENAVTAIGRGSALVLDNLGIVLDAAKAEEIYAEALGKTVEELTAYEKSQSFAKAATIEIAKAGKEASVEVDGLASSWRQAATDLTNFKTAWLGFDDDLGTLRENLRGLDEETLAKLAAGSVGDLQQAMRAQQALAKGAQQRLESEAKLSQEKAKQLRADERRILSQAASAQNEQVVASLREEAARVGAEAVAAEEEATGRLALAREESAKATKADAGQWTEMLEQAANIEGGWSDSHENRIKSGEALRREAAAALGHVKKDEAAAIKATADAETAATAKSLDAEISSNDFMISMAEARNAKEAEILPLQLLGIELREKAALAVGDETKALELRRQYVLLEEQAANRKPSGGRKRDPNEALDRETGATLRLLDARTKVYEAELAGERDLDSVAASRSYLLSLEREALDIREAAADSRKVRGAADEDKLAAERLEILTERRLLDVEAMALATEEGRRHGEESLAAMDREIELYAAQGVAVGLLQRRRDEAHLSHVAQYGEQEELAAVANEQAIAAIERDREYETELAQRKLDAFTMETETAAARGQQIYDITSRQLELEAQVAAAEGDHDRQRQLLHQRDVARIEERRAKVQRATQNANSMITQGAAVFDMVTGLTIKNEKKREKAALRARGVESIARAALETVESVAAFASLNIPQGILHAVAAGVGFTTGFAMIAGKEPGGGGGSAAGAASGGGADHQTVLGPDASSSAGAKGGGLPTTPPSAEELIRLRNGTGASSFAPSESKGGTVINISHSTVVSGDAGSLLSDLGTQDTRKWGSR